MTSDGVLGFWGYDRFKQKEYNSRSAVLIGTEMEDRKERYRIASES